MDVSSAIPTLLGMVADGLEFEKATMTEFSESGSPEVYSFQFNPSTLRLSQTNGRTPGQTLSKDKNSASYLSLPPVKGCALRFTAIIDRSEVRPQGLLETAAYMLNSLNPLFVPIPVSMTKSLMDDYTETSPILPFSSAEKIANNIEVWYRWAGSKARESGSSSTDSTMGDLTVQPLTFDYGKFQFKGHIQSLNVTMSVFDAAGNPRRAQIEVGMEGIAVNWHTSK